MTTTEKNWMVALVLVVLFGWLTVLSVSLHEAQEDNDSLAADIYALRMNAHGAHYSNCYPASKGLNVEPGKAQVWDGKFTCFYGGVYDPKR